MSAHLWLCNSHGGRSGLCHVQRGHLHGDSGDREYMGESLSLSAWVTYISILEI